ncbi:endo-1,4-beta-xylanase [Planosporangium flavigriseum]|uniref:Beta-xylanase n=1 Tax=Planosporangium flavigriseum TaxID=373681 RepID=A0A8J3PM35_9ACTN|nr:endo-1,4-beta-xylanase [Planosporangium flavigriseum]GIG73473.1 beta-xylanase [Planosporangium flavigriseum]
MRIRHALLAGALGATTALAGQLPAAASPDTVPVTSGSGRGAAHPADSLRDLAARVGLRMGTAVTPFELDNAAYRAITAQQFSSVTPGNEMKWQVVEPTRGTYDWSAGDRLVDFARRNHQLVRGHVLLWHNQLPDWLTSGVADGTISDAQLRALLHKHVTDQVTHYKGRIWQWDVANEFFTDGDASTLNAGDFWVAHLGPGIIADAFRWAHQADPTALLFYNDYNIEGVNAKSDAVYTFVRDLRAHGVPIHGVGLQAHLATQYGFPYQMRQNLQRFADLGLKVAVTEADVRTPVKKDANGQYTDEPLTPQAQAAQESYWAQSLQACLAVRECISYTAWGFGDANSWVPSWFVGEGAALLYDRNLNPKPQYNALRDILTHTAAPHRSGRGAGRG